MTSILEKLIDGYSTEDEFKIQAGELQELITNNKLDDSEIIQIFVTRFIGESSLWTTPDLNKSAIVRFPNITQIIQTFASEILEKYVKSVFLRHNPVNIDKRSGKSKKQTFDSDSDSESRRREIEQGSNFLYWCILHLKDKDIEKTIGLITPPTLSLIDDYDVNFKTRGVTILDYLLKELKHDIIQRTGLGEVFHEALIKCLTYQSEESHVSLLHRSFSAIISLISLTEKTNSETRYIKYEQILSNNVVRGFIFSGDRIVIRIILLQQIPKLSQELGIVTIKYLQELVQAICDSLEVTLEFTNKEQVIELHYAAAKGLEKIVNTCFPRIPQYKGHILKSIATSWNQIMRVEFDNDKLDMLKNSLHNIFQLLKLTCAQNNVNMEKDIQALLELDIKIFESLLN